MNALVIVWRVTERCNLSCPFCEFDRTQTRSRREADAAAILRFGHTLARWKEHAGKPVLVSWLGGEPLLWNPLTAITEEFHRSHGFAISATTNGTTLHRETTRRHLIEHYAELTVSVDGFSSRHDRLRGQVGLFDEVKRGVMALHGEKQRAGRGPMLRANVVLMRETIGEFPGLCRELAGWGIEEIVCNQLGGTDRPEFYPAHRLAPEQVEWLTEMWSALRGELASAGVRLQGSQGYLRRMAATARGQRQAMDECHPGERFLFITETGIASPCSFTTREYGVPLEEISTVEELLALPERFRTKRRERAAAACADCQSTQVCGKFATAA